MSTKCAMRSVPRLLIIDDDRGVTDLFQLIANELGFDILCVHVYEDILKAYRAFSPDIIFLDLRLPGYDGVEVLHLFSQIGCRTKIYLISGLDQSTLDSAGALGRLDQLNIAGTLRKPFLVDHVEQLLLEETDRDSSFTSDKLQELLGLGEFRLYCQPALELNSHSKFQLTDVEMSARWHCQNEASQLPSWLLERKLGSADMAASLSKSILMKSLECYESMAMRVDCGIVFRPEFSLFHDPEFPYFVSDQVRNSVVTPDKLTLGIHESQMLTDSATVLDVVTRLRINGFNISVEITNADTDELDRLLHLPVNELRLCPELVASIPKNLDAEFDISTLISACNKREIRTRADGINSESLLDFLVECGCTSGQGSFLSPPLKVQDFKEYVQEIDNDLDADVHWRLPKSG